MTNIHEMFPSMYISAYDLRNKHVTLVVDHIDRETVERENRKTKRMEETTVYVVYFQKARKGLLLNKTNATTIAELYGDESDNWVGKAVTLYPTVVKAFGKQRDAVRIEDRKPPVKQNGNAPVIEEEPPAELNIEGVPDEEEIDINAAAGL